MSFHFRDSEDETEPVKVNLTAFDGVPNSDLDKVEARLIDALNSVRRFKQTSAQRVPVRESPAEPKQAVADAELAQKARAILKTRTIRSAVLGSELFAEPAWDILLELFVSHIEQTRTPVTSACSASKVPTTTALRCLANLEDAGFIYSSADRYDGRRRYVALTPSAVEKLRSLLSQSPFATGAAR